MNKMMITVAAGVAALNGVAAGLYGDTPDAKHAWAVHDWNRPKPTKVTPAPYVQTGVPSDAIVLFDGTKESFEKNWCDSKGNPSLWKLGKEGDFYCVPDWKNGGGIQTRQEFGDCQLHIEYRHEADITDFGKGPQMRGNSGVFFMGTGTGHEIQVLESFYTSKEMDGKPGFVDNYTDGQAGSVYAENPPMVNPARKPGEWQVYDIVYHQEVWDGLKLLHPGSVTVFFNGVLVQDHWELEGLTTHCKRRPLAPVPSTKGPLALQDHGCTVHFRNIWIRPIPSRWDNKTHCTLSADENEVMKLRRETAKGLFAKIADPKAVTAENVKALGEVVSYANEGEFAAAFNAAAAGYKAKLEKLTADEFKAQKGEIEAVRRALDVLIRGNVIRPDFALRTKITEISVVFAKCAKK